jgi:hypothetical protein
MARASSVASVRQLRSASSVAGPRAPAWWRLVIVPFAVSPLGPSTTARVNTTALASRSTSSHCSAQSIDRRARVRCDADEGAGHRVVGQRVGHGPHLGRRRRVGLRLDTLGGRPWSPGSTR